MACIVLVGGGISCGKTTLINFLIQNKADLFNNNHNDVISGTAFSGQTNFDLNCFVIHFDNLCSIEEQEKLMKSLRGLRNFRCDLLMAAERFIDLTFHTGNSLAGPLSERSFHLLQKINSTNKISFNNSAHSVIFVEDNFYYRSMRYDWFQIARRTNFGFATVFLQCPLNIAVDRNSNRGYQIPEDRIKKMLTFIEYPDPKKYKWEKLSVVFDTSSDLTNSSLTDVVSVITEALQNPIESIVLEDKIEAQKICSKNVIHQSDRILRKIVSKIISNLKVVYIDDEEEENFKTIISNLVNIRQKLLSDIKQSKVSLPQDLVEKIQHLGIETVLEDYEEFLQKLFMSTLEEESLELNNQFDNLQVNG